MPMNSPGSVPKTSTPSSAARRRGSPGARPTRTGVRGAWCTCRRARRRRAHVDELDDGGDDDGGERRLGRSSNGPVRNSSATTVSTAASSPETCVRAPADALTAVLERLPLTTIPLRQAGGEVGAAERDQLAVGVDPLAAGRVRLGRAEPFGERDQHHADPAARPAAGVARARRRAAPSDGRPLRSSPTVGTSSAEHLDRGDRRPRPPRADPGRPERPAAAR